MGDVGGRGAGRGDDSRVDFCEMSLSSCTRAVRARRISDTDRFPCLRLGFVSNALRPAMGDGDLEYEDRGSSSSSIIVRDDEGYSSLCASRARA